MKIKFKISEEDFIQFNIYHMENSPSQKKMFYFARYLLPLIFSIMIYWIGTGVFQQGKLFWLIIALGFLIFWIVRYPEQYRKFIRKQVQKMLEEGDNSSVFTDKTLIISHDQLTVTDQFSSNTIVKENIKDVKIYDDLLVIYISSIVAEIIPRRYLNSEFEKELMNFLKEIASTHKK